MRKILLLSFLILFSCSKEDNSGLLDQISNLQSQNLNLQTEINFLRSQVSQIPYLESQLNQALSNYESSIINIEALSEQINSIKLNYIQISREVSDVFDIFDDIPYYIYNKGHFFWGNFKDENDNSRGAYMFQFNNDNSAITIPFWISYTETFNPTLNVYKWNGDCWVYIEGLSLRENGESYIEGVKNYADSVRLSTMNFNVDAQTLGFTSGYDTVAVRINFNIDTDAVYRAAIEVFDSNYNNIFYTPWTSLNLGTQSDTFDQICPD